MVRWRGMARVRPLARVLKNITVSAAAVAASRLRGRRVSPRWSFMFEAGVKYLRDGFRYLDTLSVPEHRAEMEAMLLPDKALRTVDLKVATFGGRPCELMRPHATLTRRTVLYLHGGSYHYGSPKTHRPLLCRLATSATAEIVALDYRLAPEHPFPAGLEDAVAAYAALLERGTKPSAIVIAGDSAGGGLAGATVLAIRERGLPTPAGAALICPWVDLAARGGSLLRNDAIDWLDAGTIEALARSYAGGAALTDPLVSPLYGVDKGDPAALPPLFVQVGSAEILVDQAVEFAQRGRAAGVDVALRVWDDMVHDWHFLASVDAAGLEAIEEVAAFVVRVTARPA
ncbi:MAG: alpha/beta hydrolase [Nannocystaceae bacterium]